jgi:hypothetical protein
VRAALALGALLAAGPARALPLRADRPLGVLTTGPWRSLFLDLPLVDARAGGQPILTLRWWTANSWSRPTVLHAGGSAVEVQQDEQADVVELTAQVAWAQVVGPGPAADRLSSGLAWRVLSHGGGWSDGLVDGWHRLLGFNDFDRPKYPKDQVHLTLRDRGGVTAVALTGPRSAAGDLVLRTSVRLLEGVGPTGPQALAARLELKVPTGRLADAGGSGGFDVGLALTWSGQLTAWLTGHAQLSVAGLSPLAAPISLQPLTWQVGVEASLAATLPGSVVVLLESRALSTLFSGEWSLGGARPRQGDALVAVTRWQNQVSVGLRRDPLTVWLSEDFTPGSRPEVGWTWFYDTNAPDLTLGLTLALP